MADEDYTQLTNEELQAEMAKNEAIQREYYRRLRLEQALGTVFEPLLSVKRDLADTVALVDEALFMTPRQFYSGNDGEDADTPILSEADAERLVSLLQARIDAV
jgi:hypothetical protein